MSVLSELSRRFHALTTDAKPDPPRVATESYTHNPNPSSLEVMQKSAPVTPDINKITEIPVTIQEQKSTPDSTTSETRFSKEQNSSTSDSPKGHFGPKSPRIKIKPKHKTSQNTNVVNYNIINSNGVRIGSKTKYICNLNQYTGNAKMKPESTSTKSKIKSMPAAVEELSACKEEISMDDMFVIKTHIGYGWRDVARQLGYSEGQIEQFEENFNLPPYTTGWTPELTEWDRKSTSGENNVSRSCRLPDQTPVQKSCRRNPSSKKIRLPITSGGYPGALCGEHGPENS